MVCLDTCFIIDILKDNLKAVLVKERIEKSSESLTIASPTIIELLITRNEKHFNRIKGLEVEIY